MVHNRYLLIWTEAGIGALVAFVLFLVTTVRNGGAPATMRTHWSLALRSVWPQPWRAWPCT